MKPPPLASSEITLLCEVFRRHSEVTAVRLFGSRAKGTHVPSSDVDLAVWGNVDALRAESIAAELDDLPLPYRYDVKPFADIQRPSLRAHIERVGILLYPEVERR
ncbi:MAG: nucleotidyltransferase domain-containing protein [Opitutaceae bacterium]